MNVNRSSCGTTAWAFTLVEALVAMFVLGVLVLALFGAFSAGMGIVQSARENTRATQIMVQKMETIRLLTWNQGTNQALAPANFTALYDPTGTNSAGAVYRGVYTAAPADSSIPAAYRGDMRQVQVTLYWTNRSGSKIRVQTRQMQTLVSRYGLQHYVY